MTKIKGNRLIFQFCMKIVKNRSENVISNPDTDLIIIYFCCLVPTRGIDTIIRGIDLFLDLVAQNGVSGHEIERTTAVNILFAKDSFPHATGHFDAQINLMTKFDDRRNENKFCCDSKRFWAKCLEMFGTSGIFETFRNDWNSLFVIFSKSFFNGIKMSNRSFTGSRHLTN